MEYDPYDYEIDKNPYPIYAYLRENQPLYFNEKLDFYALPRFQDVIEAITDWENYSSTGGATLEPIPSGPMMIVQDPPQHSILRGVVRERFTPRAIARFEPTIRAIVCERLDPWVGQTSFDVVADFSALFPMDVISSLLGIPKEDRDTIRKASNASLSRKPGEPMPPPESIAAAMRSRELLGQYISERRSAPRDDLMSKVVHAEVQDIDGSMRKLTQEELLGFFGLLSAAGNETLTKFFGNAINVLASQDDARVEITNNVDCIPDAVEEILRYDPPTHYVVRLAMNDIEIHGGVIPRGKKVALLLGSACRDEREFEDPDRMHIQRKIERQLALGFGRHQCLGAALVRLEGRIALEEFHRRFPHYEVIREGIGWVHSSNVRGFSNLPVRVK